MAGAGWPGRQPARAAGVEVEFADADGVRRREPLAVAGTWRSSGWPRCGGLRRSVGSATGRVCGGSPGTGEHVGHESWLERDRLMALDADPEVVAVASQPMWLRWASKIRAGRCVMPRISSPAARMAPAWSSTSAPTSGSASGRGSVRGHRACAPRSGGTISGPGSSPRCTRPTCAGCLVTVIPGSPEPELAARLGEVFAEPGPLLGGAAAAGDPVAVLPVLFGMLWRGELAADLERGLLGPATLVHARGGCAAPAGQRGYEAGRVSGRGLPVLAPGDEIRLGGQAYRWWRWTGRRRGWPMSPARPR